MSIMILMSTAILMLRTSNCLFIKVMCIHLQHISNLHDFVKPNSGRITFNVNDDSDVDSDIDVED